MQIISLPKDGSLMPQVVLTDVVMRRSKSRNSSRSEGIKHVLLNLSKTVVFYRLNFWPPLTGVLLKVVMPYFSQVQIYLLTTHLPLSPYTIQHRKARLHLKRQTPPPPPTPGQSP